jgi:hypothetical protein
MKKFYFSASLMLFSAFMHAQIVCPNSIKTSAGSTPSTPTFVLNNGQGCSGWPATIIVDGTLTYNFVSCSGVNLKYAIQSGQTAPSTFAMTVNFGSGVLCGYDSSGNPLVLSSRNDFSKVKASISPNPTKGEFRIALDQFNTLEQVDIFSVSGRMVYNGFNKADVDISNLSSGLYILKAKTKNGQFTRKIIKK